MLHQYEVAPPKPPFGIKGRCHGAAVTEGLTTPQFGIVVLLRSQARLQFSLPHWAYYGLFPPLAAASVRPSVSFADSIPQFSMVAPLRSRARLRYSLLHWAYFALFRPQGARFVRPLDSKGSLLDSGTTV